MAEIGVSSLYAIPNLQCLALMATKFRNHAYGVGGRWLPATGKRKTNRKKSLSSSSDARTVSTRWQLRSPILALDTILIKTPKEFWQIRDQTKSMQKRLRHWLKLVLSQCFTEIVIR